MIKYLLLFMFLTLSSFSFANNINNDEAKLEAKLQKEFGYDLTHVPFFLRFSFSKEFDKDWKDSDYLERKVFLADYEKNLAIKQAMEKAEAKAAAAKEKELFLEKKEALSVEKERLKARLVQEKSQRLAEKKRQRELKADLKEQHKTLQEMMREFEQSRRHKGAPTPVGGPSQMSDQDLSQGSPQGSGQGSY